MNRYLCVHGHFYQPPRENPWLEAIEVQDSAYPFHDWNARVTAECYAPNAFARILADDGSIERIVNNYSRMSFNFGPTLLAWLETADPETYRAILAADRDSAARFSGHGNALAQVYNHMILPLAGERDRRTQVRWGIADFTHRFGRHPEGMWLAETAADTPTLEALAAEGIRFTILAPGQCHRIRPLAGGAWQEVHDGVDPSRPYLLRLPSGREIVLFFYDGPVSRAVAFEGLLRRGEHFAGRLLSGFDERRDWPQLVHVATDGESYGHHHRHGEMALAWALELIDRRPDVGLTNYGEYLERHPPRWEATIHEPSAWSCAHGVGRWKEDCGCWTSGDPEWSQGWRQPLREALDWLRDALAPRWEAAAGELLADPWAARDDYVEVVLDRSPERREAFLQRHRRRPLEVAERIRLWKLLELQRHAMLMYTSCGWFFSELSGIETVQVIAYAGRAVQLAEETLGESLEEPFLQRLARAKSNLPEQGDGRRIYEQHVAAARLDLAKLAAHYAVSSLFQEYPEEATLFAFDTRAQQRRELTSGRAKLALGVVDVTSRVTEEFATYSYAVLHFGDHHVNGGVRTFQGQREFETMAREVQAAFDRADFAAALRLLDRTFVELTYSLRTLFRDEQRRVVDLLLGSTLDDVEEQYRQIYQGNAPLMRFLSGIGARIPRALQVAAELVLDHELRDLLADPDGDRDEALERYREIAAWGLHLDTAGLSFALGRSLEALSERLGESPDDVDAIERLRRTAALVRELPFAADLSRAQNRFWRLRQTRWPEQLRRAEAGDAAAAAWVEAFRELGAELRLPLPVTAPV